MNTAIRKSLSAFGLIAAVMAAALAGQVIIDFTVPEYSPEGRLKSRLRGTRAVVEENGNVDIENLRLDIFPENGQNIAIVAPTCRFLERYGIVESDGDVLVRTPGLLITGTGFRWERSGDKGVIRSNVCVTIKNSEGLYRREP